MGFRVGVLKLILVVPNVVTFLIGCAMTVFSSIAIASLYKYEDEKNLRDYDDAYQFVRGGAALGLTAGLLTSIVSILALCGALADSRPLLIAYSVIMSLVLVFEIVAAVLGFIFINEIKSNFEDYLEKDLDSWKYPDRTNRNDSNFLIELQNRIDCCGVKSPADWLAGQHWKPDFTDREPRNRELPSSCCSKIDDEWNKKCYLSNFKKESPRFRGERFILRSKEGCYDKLLDGAHILGEASIVGFFIQLLVLLIAIYFARKIKEDQSVLIF